jgi:hypothetical protein
MAILEGIKSFFEIILSYTLIIPLFILSFAEKDSNSTKIFYFGNISFIYYLLVIGGKLFFVIE